MPRSLLGGPSAGCDALPTAEVDEPPPWPSHGIDDERGGLRTAARAGAPRAEAEPFAPGGGPRRAPGGGARGGGAPA